MHLGCSADQGFSISQAAKFFDIVIGIDMHLVQVPTPAGPVPVPADSTGFTIEQMQPGGRNAPDLVPPVAHKRR